MKYNSILSFALLILLAILFTSCGNGEEETETGDNAAPTVNDIILTGDSASAATNGPIMVVFSKAIDPVSIHGAVTCVPHVEGSVCCDDENRILIFKPNSDLQPHTKYSVTISNVADNAGNIMEPFSFEVLTGVKDTIPPFIKNTLPNDGDSDVPVDTAFSIQFSERIDKSSFGKDLSLTPETEVPVDRWIFKWSEDDKSVEVFIPLELGLEPEKRYNLKIGSSSVVDLVGNKMGKSLTVEFRTSERSYEDINPESQTALQQEWLYIIWKQGDIWHIIWGGSAPAGATKRGQGSIYSKEGEVDDVNPVLWEAGDTFNLTKDGTLTFNGAVNGTGGTDGLEFRVKGKTVTFRLSHARPEWIFIGKDRKHPQSTTFTLLNEDN
jgi:hypothetical protein